MPQSDHKGTIQTILGSTSGWEVIERHNPAEFLPSDFALMQVKDNSTPIIEKLRLNSEIRHITPQRRYIDSLNSLEEETDIDITDTIEFWKADPSGRPHTQFPKEDIHTSNHSTLRKLHEGLSMIQVTDLFHANLLWERGYTGTGIKVAVFDTGLRASHPHFKNIKDRTNWTWEPTLEDSLGHGTFVAGVIASQTECLGFAPDVDIYAFRVFTSKRVSYTSWFLDAFNYAIHKNINILNLSIGGPDFLDLPFIEKVWEMSANNIIVVSAIGNDGPLYGTLNNPADQMDVIGVGGIDFKDHLASFSSRGMTTWELPHGYGRVKPDIVAYGQSVSGSRIYGGCKKLSGTSVASPVVAGAVALLASTISVYRRWEIINPASMKQALVETADRIAGANIFEQGLGKLNLLKAYEFLQHYELKASVIPDSLDFTDCPYMWPYCTQPLYYSSMPIIFNVTVLNGLGVLGEIIEPEWIAGSNGEMIDVSFDFNNFIWPWSGYLGLIFKVNEKGSQFKGDIEGLINFVVKSPNPLRSNSAGGGGSSSEDSERKTILHIPVKLSIIPTPPKEKRILFDQYHNLRYPSGYFPLDSLSVKDEPFDWNGDHIHTNFKDLYTFLRSRGYFVEVLGDSFMCFNASNYGTLLIVDPEEEFWPEEIEKLKKDIENGLSIAVFADWYNLDVMQKLKFFDENTKQWWTPATGGANIPALNDLLKPYGIAFNSRVYDGEFSLDGYSALFASGAGILHFPKGGTLIHLELFNQTHDLLYGKVEKVVVPVLGLFSLRRLNNSFSGRISVFGDSSCLDNAHQRNPCYWLLEKIVQYTSLGLIDENIFAGSHLDSANFVGDGIPVRNPDSDLFKYSKTSKDDSSKCFERKWKSVVKSVDLGNIWDKVKGNGFSAVSDGVGILDATRIEGNGILVKDNINDTVLPYLILFGACIMVFVLAMRSRKERGGNARRMLDVRV